MSANSKESFAFILCLLCFAVAASGYVLYHGLEVRRALRPARVH